MQLMDDEPPVTPLLRVEGLSKSFVGTRALASVHLSILPGEIHGLVGQNGSGKSTLIKILSGYHAPDGGTVTIRGEAVRLPFKPGEAQGYGLAFLHQDLSLVESMTVLENLRVGQYETTWYGRLRWGSERRRVRALLDDMNLELDPDRLIRDVPQAERALIAFIRALRGIDRSGGILILDEPTAHLPAPAVERLFKAIRGVTQHGSGVLFVSHRLEEVLAICDRVSVLRDGGLVGTVNTADVNQERLVSMLLGRELGTLYPERVSHAGQRVLTVQGLSGRIAQGVDLELDRGEIVGLTGLVGMGQDEVPYLIFGEHSASAGAVAVGRQNFTRMSPMALTRAGVALLPADRARASGVLRATVLENVTLPTLGRYFTRGILHSSRERRDVNTLIERFDVRPRDPDRLLATLSGGNQQKALLGKWLQMRPLVLLLHEPTQGVDIGSRRQIFRIIREVAESGVGVLIASAEYEDLANMCDRVLVMRRGRVVCQLSGRDLTEDRIVEQCYLAA